jgi:hypothetical protein
MLFCNFTALTAHFAGIKLHVHAIAYDVSDVGYKESVHVITPVLQNEV